MREKLFTIFDRDEEDKISQVYDASMMIVIIISVIPLAFKEYYGWFKYSDAIVTVIFVMDYLARWIVVDKKLKMGVISFLIYPFTPWAIIDLLSLMPSFAVIARGFKILRLFRIIRTFRLLRMFKMFKHSKNIRILMRVIIDASEPLSMVGILSIGYILVSALVIFNVEPQTFESFFEAIYWATVSLTTVGYGDIYPVTNVGRIITMISSFLGIAVVALPAGIITAGYMEAIGAEKKSESTEEDGDTD